MTTPSEEDTVVASLVQHLVNLCTARGLPTQQAMQAAGIPASALRDTAARVPVAWLVRLVRFAAEVTNDRLIGLKLAQEADSSSFGIAGMIIQSSATLGELIQMSIDYERVISDVGITTCTHLPGAVLWRWECRFPDAEFARQTTEYTFGCWARLIRMLWAQRPGPLLAVRFGHPAPADTEDLSIYFDAFQCPVFFDSLTPGVLITAASIRQPLCQPNMAVREYLEEQARRILEERNTKPGFTSVVRGQLRLLLHQGQADRDRLAEVMNISSRQLHRRLEAEGTSYRDLLESLRLELAKEILNDGHSSIDTVADRLCFSGAQSLIRWFKARTGMTPAEYRRSVG